MAKKVYVYEIPLDKITLSELNVRKTEPDKELEELADSIKELGLIQPVVLRACLKTLDFVVAAG